MSAQRNTERGHRYYDLRDIELIVERQPEKYLVSIVQQWMNTEQGYEPVSTYYCQTSVLFQTRLMKMETLLSRHPHMQSFFPLLVAIAGEVGNNSFDHNLGRWHDVPGIFFGYSLNAKKIILADRGQGVLETLRRVRPQLTTDHEALRTAFTEIVTGRAPEHRGNGLKFVRSVVEHNPQWKLFFQSGNASAHIHQGHIQYVLEKNSVRGCIAIIDF